MATSHAIIHAGMPASGHPLTQDYTKASIGAPKASIILGARNAVVNTDINDIMYTFGLTTPANNNMILGGSYEDNEPNSDCKVYQDADGEVLPKLITQSEPGTDNNDILADYDSAITDGIRLDFTATDGSARRMTVIHLVEGIDQVSLDYVQLVSAGTVTVTPGFQADLLIAFSNSSNVEPSSNNLGSSIGFYHRADNAHRLTGLNVAINGSDTPLSGCASDDGLIVGKSNHASNTMFNTFNAENFTSTQYDITQVSGTSAPQVIILAIKLTAGYSAKVGSFNCPVSTGITSVITGLSFTPQIAFLNTVGVTAQNTNTEDNCEWCVGFCDADDQVASGGYIENVGSVANTDCQQWHREDSSIYIVDNTQTLRVKAAFQSFESDGLDLNFSDAEAGWDLICNYLVIGKDPGGAIINKVLTESTIITDPVPGTILRQRIPGDRVELLSDGVFLYTALGRLLFDNFEVADAISLRKIVDDQLSQASDLTDALDIMRQVFRQVSEAIAVGDNITTAIALAQVTNDSLSLTDNDIQLLERGRLTQDSFDLNDLFNKIVTVGESTQTFVVLIEEIVNIPDTAALSFHGTNNRAFADTLSVGESIALNHIRQRVLLSEAGLIDSALANAVRHQQTIDILSTADSIVPVRRRIIDSADSFDLSDSSESIKTQDRLMIDSLIMDEDILVTRTAIINSTLNTDIISLRDFMFIESGTLLPPADICIEHGIQNQ